ncbi:MAG: ligase-associated DNA damage response endonuclease PdeM [Winogradskyella sp.]|uniref:ligase-associated DNA damage response endonuclease PdeM n=1 Tax=Winogradskyella sp. TaxID=1883156 RepID=UPI001795030D|nr:ligase-associated DNA damage response endonuclease PdeM [Winogradskyella sp.]
MEIIEEHINLCDESVTLTNQRALFWPRNSALILSDLHIGKTGHFKKHGIPMPDAILQKDLNRLKALIEHFNANQLIVVGDLFHAEANNDMLTFKTWMTQFQNFEIVLIKGNHDRLSKKMMADFNFRVETELEIEPFLFVHEQLKKHENHFTISGHIHPGVLLKGKGKQKLKLPCYQLTKNQLILPAFSLFTGLNTKSAPNDAICYAFTESSIFRF